MHNAENTENLLARWLAGELSEEELGQLQQREDYADLKQLVDGMDSLGPPAFDESASWQKLNAKRQALQDQTGTEEAPVVQVNETKVRQLNPMRRIMSIAAAILALVAIGWWVFSPAASPYDNTFATGVGEQMEFKLPDGSTVNLNAVSTLEYASEDWPEGRTLQLNGEAHFRVKKGSTFTVNTEQGQVKVVGTIFNVNVREGAMDVKCTHGKVQIISPKDKKVLIKAGEQVSVVDGNLQKRRGIDFVPKWFQGESLFKSTALDEVFDELERQFEVTVIHGDLSERSFTGKFNHDQLEDAIKRICPQMDLECTMQGDTLIVQ